MNLKHNLTKEEYTLEQKRFVKYRNEVLKITRKQPLSILENHRERGRNKFHLDHIISIRYGYMNDVDPEIIGNIKNLRFIPSKENIGKSSFLEKESSEMIQYYIEEGTL